MSQRRTSYTAQNFFWPSWKRRTRSRYMPFHVSTLQFMTVGINPLENNTPQFHKCATTILKNNQGQYVRVRKRHGVSELIVDELQDGAVCGKEFVEIWKWNNYFVLCFKYGEEIYLVTVNGNNLMLRKTTDVTQEIRDINSWFRKDNVGMGADQYCIKTANSNSPTKYLVIKSKRTRFTSLWCVTLSDTKAANGIFTTPPCQCNEEGCTGL